MFVYKGVARTTPYTGNPFNTKPNLWPKFCLAVSSTLPVQFTASITALTISDYFYSYLFVASHTDEALECYYYNLFVSVSSVHVHINDSRINGISKYYDF